MIETNADAPSTRAGGRWSNFSISGKEMSTCGRPVERRCSRSCGRRCSVWGPKTRSTYGARRTIASPSWLATQPATPMSRSGFARLSGFTRPRSANTFSCAFSRTEHVLNRMRSASPGSAVFSNPSAAASTSAIFSESYSFIWHPKVRMKTFFGCVMEVLVTELNPGRGDALHYNVDREILQESSRPMSVPKHCICRFRPTFGPDGSRPPHVSLPNGAGARNRPRARLPDRNQSGRRKRDEPEELHDDSPRRLDAGGLRRRARRVDHGGHPLGGGAEMHGRGEYPARGLHPERAARAGRQHEHDDDRCRTWSRGGRGRVFVLADRHQYRRERIDHHRPRLELLELDRHQLERSRRGITVAVQLLELDRHQPERQGRAVFEPVVELQLERHQCQRIELHEQPLELLELPVVEPEQLQFLLERDGEQLRLLLERDEQHVVEIAQREPERRRRRERGREQLERQHRRGREPRREHR